MKLTFEKFLLLFFLLCSSLFANKNYGMWEVYEKKTKNQHAVFMLSHPISKTGTYKKRDAPYMSISCWLKLGIHGDVSIFVGYPLNPKKKILTYVIKHGINGWRKKFQLDPVDENAWFSSTDDEESFIECIKKGDVLKVKAHSTKNTYSLDTYSLKGSMKAYKDISKRLIKQE